MNLRITAAVLATLLACGAGAAARAETTASWPWIRGTVPQQQSTGAFMTLKSTTGGKLVGASSPAAGSTEIHEMAMDGNVMRMRQVASLDLPAGQAVELKPGGFHLMLMMLKAPLKAGDMVPITLVVEGKDGKRETIEVKAPVKALGNKAL